MMPAMSLSPPSDLIRPRGRPGPGGTSRPALRPFVSAACGVLLLGQVACGGSCSEERKRTLASLERARGAHADVYAPETYGKASSLADQADAECREQEKRLLPLHTSRSRQLQAEARQEAEQAAREGTENEGIARQEALNSRYLAIESVEDARASLVRAQKEKGEAAVGDLADSFAGLRRALSEMEARIDRKEYLPARDLGARIVRESVRFQAAVNRRALGLPAVSEPADRLY